MITIRRKRFLFHIAESWNGINKSIFKLFHLCMYRNINTNEKAPFLLIKSIETTIENDLTLDENLIFSKFKKQFRNAIQQAKRSNIECYFSNDKISFQSFYNSFAAEKKLTPISMTLLDRIGDNLYISFAVSQGKIYAAHCYMVDFDAEYVLLFRSASRRIIDKEIEPNSIGKANKFLHYKDMLYFKSLGIKTYGFGGYSYNKTLDLKYGINKFKSNFGGQIVNKFRYITIPYFLIKFLSTKLKKMKF
jgi:hypothetical protein